MNHQGVFLPSTPAYRSPSAMPMTLLVGETPQAVNAPETKNAQHPAAEEAGCKSGIHRTR